VAGPDQPVDAQFEVIGALDLPRTLAPLYRGLGDPTMKLAASRIAWATSTRDGPATLLLEISGRRLRARAWGPGRGAAIARVPALVGLDDADRSLAPHHPLVTALSRRLAGLRIGRTGRVMDSLIPAILEQKVTGRDASRGLRGLIYRYGQPAPGPFALRLLPRPEVLAGLPYYAFHPLGVERRRADTVRWAAAHADRLEEIVDLPLQAAYARLRALPGVGPWTAAEVASRALGDRDAVSVGDFHIPNLVAFALAGEPRGDDARMLELLEPYKGQRGRVIRLLEASGIEAPRYGPRLVPRAIATI
jgi:3-methyladenine DNA glycosylase/8-oxoguanine DNA glycosylase